jgi:hypothetical protein
MIYKFKSKSAGDVIMMGANGDQLLRLLGREPAPKGILESATLPAAITALEQAVAADEQARAEAEAEAARDGKKLPAAEGVSLRQRVWPMVDMMKRAHKNGHDIVWGV